MKLVLEAGEPALVLNGFTDQGRLQLHRLACSHPFHFTPADIATLHRITDRIAAT